MEITPLYEIIQAKINAKVIPIFKLKLALCSLINDFLLINIIMLMMTKGNGNTLNICVKICALIGFAPKIGTAKPMTQAIAVNILNCLEFVSNSPF